uniref:Uncharacterized protein n=1 Tax=Arundo donax TaxID=35708 RepID=A0A0A9HGU2_ARUDO
MFLPQFVILIFLFAS